jgi:hypothetical protein
MRINRTSLLCFIAASCCAARVMAGPVSGELFYTRYQDQPNVKKVAFTYDGSSFVLASPTVVGTTPGADGIVGNPQNSNLLIVGNQGPAVSTIDRNTGAVTTYSSPVAAFHLSVPTSTTLLASSIPGNLARFDILSTGALSPGTIISLSGSSTVVTSVIDTPTGFFYTTASPSGGGQFGTLTFNAPVGTATSAVTQRIFQSVASAHGGAYDPFSNSVLLFGDSYIGQYNLGTQTFAERFISGGDFDQGAVDGNGHIFIASNNGNLTFVDYSASGGDIFAGSTFVSTQFLDTYVDDVAPLIGTGGTNNVPDSASSLALLSLGCLALGFIRRRVQ